MCVYMCMSVFFYHKRIFSKTSACEFWGMYESVLYGLFHDGFYDCSVHGLSCFSHVQLFATP